MATETQESSSEHRELLKVRAARVSLCTNLFLTVFKISVGVLSGTVSVVSEGAHSASDLIASAIALYSVQIADQPPDADHPYGHGNAESLSALAEALLLFGAAVFIIWEAIAKLIRHDAPARVDWGIAVMVISALVNVALVRYMTKVARDVDSMALEADAQNHRVDITTAAGVLVGLVLVRLTGFAFFDPLLAIIVALVILREVWVLSVTAIGPLMGRTLPDADVAAIRAIFDADSNVRSYHKLRTRKAGSERFVDAHVLMDDEMTLLDAHEATEELEAKIRIALPSTSVALHTEPFQAEQRHQEEEERAAKS